MGSTRLPGKVRKDLVGDTVLARVVNRTRRARLLDDVVVATSTNPNDDVIGQECERLSVACFRGDEADVLDRYYQTAKHFRAFAVVRITSDCPLIDPELIDLTVRGFLDRGPDYATNSLVITYPRGLDVEVFTMDALDRCWQSARETYERVHVTPYMYEHPSRFKILSLTADDDYSRYRWTLDTAEDLEMIRAIYQHFDGKDDFGWREVLRLVESAPQLAALNSQVPQKALREG
jgi:spore coat polysaccharide biosynthesis protein SpsF